MPQDLTRTQMFAKPRTAKAATGLTRELHSDLGGTTVAEIDPGAQPGPMTPDSRAVLAAAKTSPGVKATEAVSSILITVDSLTGAPPAPWPANESGRPSFLAIVEVSEDGKDWAERARIGPFHGPGTEVRTLPVAAGQHLRIREAVGGNDAAVSYTVDLVG